MTKCGKDPLLSADENTANLIEPPTEEEKDQAITGNLSNILVLVSGIIADIVISLIIVDESCQKIQRRRRPQN